MKIEIVPITVSVRFLEVRKECVDRNEKEQTEKSDAYFVYYKLKLSNKKQLEKSDTYLPRNAIRYKNNMNYTKKLL